MQIFGSKLVGIARNPQCRRRGSGKGSNVLLTFQTSWLILDSWKDPAGIINRKSELDLEETTQLAL